MTPRQALTLAVLALCAAGVGWQATRPATPAAAGGTPTSPAAASSPAANETVPPRAAAAGASAPASKAHIGSADPTARWPVTPAPRTGTVEVCHLGTAPEGSDQVKALTALAQQQAQHAGQRLYLLMLASPDAATRAAAQLALDQKDALAEVARQTQDPTVYAFALQACGRGGTPPRTGHCSQLSTGQMARLDASNAVPWLAVAIEAEARGDQGGMAEALYRASLATSALQREVRFTDLALSAIPPDWPVPDAMHAASSVLQLQASLAVPSYLAAVRYCAANRMHDSNVQQTCSRLAGVLAERGDSLVDFGIGIQLGERAGWPAASTARYARLHQAYKQTQTDADQLADKLPQATSCQALRTAAQTALAHARLGERRYAEQLRLRMGLAD